MKTISKTLLLTAMAAGLAACGGDETEKTSATSNNTSTIKSQQYHNATINLQGETRDGVTNAPIDGVKITLIQGGSVRSTTTRNSEEAGLKGTYFMSGIPATVTYGSVSDENTYKIVISKEGYRTYQADMKFSVDGVENKQLQNAVFNKMGVFKLYPNSVVPADIKVRVHFNGKPVKNQSISLRPATPPVSPGTPGTPESNFGSVSLDKYVAHVTATTDDNGVATFSGSSLVAGVKYKAYSVPMSYTDGDVTTLLAQSESGTATAGLQNGTTLGLSLSPANSNDGGLYITKASNDEESAKDENGKLIITFSENIKLVSDRFDTLASSCLTNEYDPDTSDSNTTQATLGTVSGTNSNNITLSVADNVLTLTPTFDNAPNASAFNDVKVKYQGGSCDILESVYVRKASGGPAYQLTAIRNSVGDNGLIRDVVVAKSN